VIHVITKLELGGAQQNTLDTCRLIDRSKYDVALLTGPDGLLDSQAARMPDLDFRIVADLAREVDPLRDARACRSLRAHIAALRAQHREALVHTHSSKAGILGRLAASRAGVHHIVHTAHGFGHPAFAHPLARGLAVFLERLVARNTSRIVCVSNANIDEGRSLRLFGAAGVELIRSGFDLETFRHPGISREDACRALGLDPARPVVGSIACLKPQKAPVDFVQVAARVREQVPDVQFVLAGDGEQRADVEQRARQLDLHETFRLLGWRDDVERVLPAFDVFLLTSRWEGLPRAVVQAMCAGIPVVATAVDGDTDVIRDGDTGFLAPAGAVEVLAQRTVGLLGSADLRSSVAEAAQHVTSEFALDEMIRRLEALYDELLDSA